MKILKILLTLIGVLLVVLLVVLIRNQVQLGSTGSSSTSGSYIEYSNEYAEGDTEEEHINNTIEGVSHNNDIPTQEYGDTYVPMEQKPMERMVTCNACHGLGHNPYEVNGNTCTVCNGNGRMSEAEMLKRYKVWETQTIPCKLCNGTGLSYEARTKGLMHMDLIAPQGYYNCKVCNGKKSGTRAELIKNFQIANQVYGPRL